MKTQTYGLIDLHSHTNRSDGLLTPSELVAHYVHIAAKRGIDPPVISITDHDVLYTQKDLLSLKRDAQNRISLIPGAEISCRYQSNTGKEVELHVLVYCYTDTSRLWELAKKNRMRDRRPYLESILEKLRKNCNIELGSLDSLIDKHQKTNRPGRSMLATELWQRGYVANPAEGLDVYFGEQGSRLAYTEPILNGLVKFEELLDAVKEDPCAIPVLAHPFYNAELSGEDRKELVEAFRVRMGDRPAGLECLYKIYSSKQRDQLYRLAAGSASPPLLISAGNDYHGQNQEELEIFAPQESSLFQYIFEAYP